MGGGEHDFFEGFTWAVPVGFRTALASCHFDEGDILYDSKHAYTEPWESKDSKLRYSVQVHSSHVATPDADAGTDEAFRTSWNGGIEVELTDYLENKTRSINTTHGRIYTVLWRGNPELFSTALAGPAPPVMAGALRPHLPSAAGVIKGRHSGKVRGGHGFVFAVDQALSAQVTKARIVEGALRSLGEVEKLTTSPALAGIEGDYCPTIVLHSYAIATTARDRIEAALKARLYKPAKDRKTQVDRFNVSMHGCLFEMEG